MRIMQRVDDLHYAADGSEVPAQHTVKLSWQVDNGKVQTAEVDLTGAHLAEYDHIVSVLLHACQANSTQPASGDHPTARSAAERLSEARRRGKAIMKFADDHGIVAMDGSGRPAYKTPLDAYYRPRWLESAYEHWVATGQVVLPRAAEEARQAFLAAQIRKTPGLDEDLENQEGDEDLHSDGTRG